MNARVLVAMLAAEQLTAIGLTQAGRISAYFLVFTLKYRHILVFVRLLTGNAVCDIGSNCRCKTDAIALEAVPELISDHPCGKWPTVD
jgi:hypothetical protein